LTDNEVLKEPLTQTALTARFWNVSASPVLGILFIYFFEGLFGYS